MKLFVSLTMLSAVLVCGCDSKPAATNTPAGTPTQPTASAPATPSGADKFRAEQESVTVAPGGQAEVKLMGLPTGEEPMISIDPPDSKVNVSAGPNGLLIEAAEGSSGECTVTVSAGGQTTTVRVKVGG